MVVAAQSSEDSATNSSDNASACSTSGAPGSSGTLKRYFAALADAVEHAADQQQLERHAEQVERDPQALLVLAQGEDHQARQ